MPHSTRVKFKNWIWQWMVILGLILLIIKAGYVVEGYRYLPWSYDSSRILQEVNSLTQSGQISFYLPPRVGIFYLASMLQLLGGLSSTDGLLIPLLLMIFLGAGLVYALAKEIAKSSEVGYIAFLFFCISVVTPQPHSANFYGFITVPLFWIATLKYLRKEASFFLLLISAMGMLVVYPPLAFGTLFVAAIPFFLDMCHGIQAEQREEIKKRAAYFFILPLGIAYGFFMSNPLINPTYLGFSNFFNRAFGLWHFAAPEKIFVITKIIIVIMALSTLIGFSMYFQRWLKPGVNFILKTFESFKTWLSQGYRSMLMRLLVKGLILLIVIDLLFILNMLYGGHDLVEVSRELRPLVYLFGSRFLGDLWSYERIAYLPYFLFALGGAFFLLDRRLHHRYDKIWFLFLPLFLIFTSLFPAEWRISDLFVSEKALGGLGGIVYSLTALTFLILINRIPKSLKQWKLLVVSIVVIFSLSASFLAIQSIYSAGVNTSVIQAVQWLEGKEETDHLFVLYPELFEPDPDANNQTFYTFSFLHSKVPFSVMLSVNQDNLVAHDIEAFEALLQEHEVRYLLIESPYQRGNIDESLKELGTVVYAEGSTVIIELAS